MIDAPGIYTMDMAAYQSDPVIVPSLSSGIAKLLVTRSPLHAWTAHPRLNPNYQSEESSKFDLGSAAHALLLEGEDRMCVVDAADWRSKAAKDARDQARADGKYPMLAHQVPAVYAMREAATAAIAANPDLSGMTLGLGNAEQVIVWQEGSAWCRIRPDWLSDDRLLQIHYKTTDASARPDQWIRTMMGMSADIEIAMYARGNRATGGPERAQSVFLVQEVSEPYACSFPALDPAFLALATEKFDAAVKLWGDCLATGNWPGYPKRTCWLEPPAWAATQWAEHAASAELVDALPEGPVSGITV